MLEFYDDDFIVRTIIVDKKIFDMIEFDLGTTRITEPKYELPSIENCKDFEGYKDFYNLCLNTISNHEADIIELDYAI